MSFFLDLTHIHRTCPIVLLVKVDTLSHLLIRFLPWGHQGCTLLRVPFFFFFLFFVCTFLSLTFLLSKSFISLLVVKVYVLPESLCLMFLGTKIVLYFSSSYPKIDDLTTLIAMSYQRLIKRHSIIYEIKPTFILKQILYLILKNFF